MDNEKLATMIYLEDCMLLSKKEYSSWREVQDEYYEKYKASFSSMSCEDILSFFEEDFGEEDKWPFSRETIVEFFRSDEQVIQSEQ
mgnify:CR=1 FL=1